jgi:hypothetical protein
MCMKLDPGMHIGLHLVFFGKSGVTVKPREWSFLHTKFVLLFILFSSRDRMEL